MMRNAFGIQVGPVSKGSPKLGLKMIAAYGKKPTTTMAKIRSSAGGSGAAKVAAAVKAAR